MQGEGNRDKSDASEQVTSQKGALAGYSNVRIPDEEAFHQACEDAWAEAAAEREARVVAEWRADRGGEQQ